MNNGILKKKDFIFNTLGSMTYSIVSMSISIIVINIAGIDIGGIFSFGFSTLLPFAFDFAYFGVRGYQIADSKYNFEFITYLKHRIITILLTFLIFFSYVSIMFCIGKYELYKSVLLLFLSIFGIFEAFYDVFESELQRLNKLYISGLCLFLRSISFLVIFLIFVLTTNNVLLSVIVAMISKLIVFYFVSYKSIYLHYNELFNFTNFNKNFIQNKNFDSIIKLTKTVLPLFVIIIFDYYSYSAGKFSIDLHLTDSYSGLYNLYFLPCNLIYLLCALLIRPLVTNLSLLYNNDKKEYLKTTNKICIQLALLIIVIFSISYLLTDLYVNLVNILSNNKYIELAININVKLLFRMSILGGGLYSLSTLIYYLYIIEDKIRIMLFIYIIVFLITIVLSNLFVIKYGIIGASISFVISMFIFALLMNLYRIIKR